MDGLRAMLCAVLPAVWLLAAGHCFAAPVTRCADECSRTVVSGGDHCGHALPVDARASKHWGRLLGRRLVKQLGSDWPAVAPCSPAECYRGTGELSYRATEPREPAGLAQYWQFFWRTASEPRAPSSVS